MTFEPHGFNNRDNDKATFKKSTSSEAFFSCQNVGVYIIAIQKDDVRSIMNEVKLLGKDFGYTGKVVPV